ncbi:hypothetical protein [Carboxylicivirga caseinilyticus]|uniref:hypothetical protein n=1 Tax=Carboxylicivirga caseinilyticus TaxID=3417572 RepID=UPI003D356183|nr:hypothetical protein [Marinilabiliaceae bacterium A049]
MKRHILLIAICIISISTFAQKHNSTVYLKNGTVIKCDILEILPNDGVKIQTGSHVLMLSNNEIDRIEMNNKKSNLNFENEKEYKGVFNKTSLGILAGNTSNNEKAPLTFTSTFGVHVTPKITLAAGSGVEFYKETIIPAFAEIQYFFKTKKLTPYLYSNGGWSFSIDDRKSTSSYEYNSHGGIRYGGGAGIRIWTNSGIGLIIEAGYQYQEIKTDKTQSYMQYESTLTDEYNRFAFKIGLYFN